MFSGNDKDAYAFGPGDEAARRELVEAYLVELDPALDGFGPVIVELYAIAAGDGREGFEVRQTATTTANRLLVFRTESEALARAVYEGEPSLASLVRYSPAGMV